VIGDIDNYIVALINGAFVIGLPNEDATELKPGYQILRSPGQAGLNQAVVPLCFFHEWREITIPPHSTTLKCSELSRPERAGLRQNIERCEEMIQKMRAEASGIALPVNGVIDLSAVRKP
jgi:hypothetical protein